MIGLGRVHRAVSKRFLGGGTVNAFGRGTVGFIDVGSVGELPDPWFLNAPKIRTLLRFEPREGGQPSREANVVSLPYALADADGERDFYIYAGRGGSGSSLLRQNIDYVRSHWEAIKDVGPRHLNASWFERAQLVRTERMKCRSLDSVLEEARSRGWINESLPMLKIDTQGAESLILQGARRYLKDECLAIHLELFRIPLYENIVLAPEVVASLEAQGFQVMHVMPPHGSFDSQNDYVLVKKDAPASFRSLMERAYLK